MNLVQKLGQFQTPMAASEPLTPLFLRGGATLVNS
jgi:hypothetical protein